MEPHRQQHQKTQYYFAGIPTRIAGHNRWKDLPVQRKMVKILAIAVTVLACVAVVGMSVLACLKVLSRVGDPRRSYAQRHIKCDPEVLARSLERVFAIDLPENVDEPKAAKMNLTIGGDIHFLLKFSADSNDTDSFVETLAKTSQNSSIDWLVYREETDGRGYHTWPLPRWFTKPIDDGKVGDYSLGDRSMTIYLDTGHKEDVVIYIKGWFLKGYGQESPKGDWFRAADPHHRAEVCGVPVGLASGLGANSMALLSIIITGTSGIFS
jgi:hypothetical protein